MKFRYAAALAFIIVGGLGLSGFGLSGCATTIPAPAATIITPTSTTAIASPPPPTKQVSKEQANAIKAAEDYLDGQHFSRKGLIGQLTYEGYPKATATAAVDSLTVDWDKQAALTAQDYLDTQTFSRKSLVAQLEFDGFTKEQAAYGVAHSGL